MQPSDIDNDSEYLSDTRDGDVHRLGCTSVHELNQCRAEALRRIDGGSFSRFHLKLCFVAGTGFLTDTYDIFAINLASVILGYVYGHTPGPGLTQRLSRNQDLGIKVAAPVGNLFGQLLFRWLVNIVGRRRMYGMEVMIILTSTFAQALVTGSGPGVNIIALLIIWRFIMGLGVGVGGDNPLSAVIASEFASTRNHGRLMTTVFTAQGWGNFATSLIALITVHAYRDSILTYNDDLKHIDYGWRILIGLGCVPSAIALYFRLTTPETPRFTMDIDRNVQKARTDIENVLGPNCNSAAVYPDAAVQRADAPRRTRGDFISYFTQPGNLSLLFGAAYSWFAIDVAYYGLGLSSSFISTPALLTRARIDSPVTLSDLTTTLGIHKSLHNVVIGSLVVCVAGLLLCYFASFFLIDFWGRRRIQFLSLAVLTVLLAILGKMATQKESSGEFVDVPLTAGIYPGTQPTRL